MSIAEQAKAVYESALRQKLEEKYCGHYIAIEPVSGAYYVEKEFVDAAMAAKRAHPEHKSFVIRIGHEAAFHIGAWTS